MSKLHLKRIKMSKIGIDLTYNPRFKNKDSLAKKILSTSEFEEYSNSLKKDEFLASRFALKEALIKCLECSILSINLNEIIVKKNENGAPFILFKNKKYDCSLSHENDYSIGVVYNG